MNIDIQNNQPLAVCLHASASSPGQWRGLRDLLETEIRVVTPQMVGYGQGEHFKPGSKFRMRDEVLSILRQIEDETGKRNGPLHLIGHSYGAATALAIAALYPERVASLTLYEPVQFLLLFEDGLRSEPGREILSVWRYAKAHLRNMRHREKAAKKFIEYWSGQGVWQNIPRKRQLRFASLMPKVVAEFEALLSCGVSAESFANLNVPVRLICGADTRVTAARVSEVLASVLPNVEFQVLEGASHMAPTTDPDRLNPILAEHVCRQLDAAVELAA